MATTQRFIAVITVVASAVLVGNHGLAQGTATYEPYSITTLAGSTTAGSTDATASAAQFNAPFGVAVDGAGTIYVADTQNSTIRKITQNGVVTTLAGAAGQIGSADRSGSNARFNNPSGVVTDSSGNIYVADAGNFTIRKITPDGTVTTLAGAAGQSGYVDAQGSAARFSFLGYLAIDGSGNIIVSDYANQLIRKVAPDGQVTTIAGTYNTQGDSDGPALGATFQYPKGVAVDPSGNIYIGDEQNNQIRKLGTDGKVTTIAGDPLGNSGYNDGTGSSAEFFFPEGIACDRQGNVYVADSNNQVVRKVTPTGVVTTLAGVDGVQGTRDGTGNQALFATAEGMAVDAAGTIYVTDCFGNNAVRKGVSLRPSITTPLSATDFVGQLFAYQVLATNNPTSYTAANLPDGLKFDAALGVIEGVATTAGTFQATLSATNASGTDTETLSINIQTPPSQTPVVVSAKSSTGRVGQAFTYQAVTQGGSPNTRLTVSGLPPGLNADAVTGLISGTPTSAGSYGVTLTVNDGAASSAATLELTFTTDPGLPVITSPDVALLTPGSAFTYTINAPALTNGADPTSYSLIGTLPSGLSFDGKNGVISGVYLGSPERDRSSKPKALSGGIIVSVQIAATNSHGTALKDLTLLFAPIGAVNISTRMSVGTGDDLLIAGFIVTGNAPKKLLIRAIGPSLSANGVSGALPDTTLALHEGATVLATNSGWRSSQEEEIQATGIPPASDYDSAMIATLAPDSYTAVVSGLNNSTGIGLAEVYDLGTAGIDTSSVSHLANISTRGTVLTGDNVMIGGFIVSGASTKILLRAIGPSLAGQGVSGALADPVLELHGADGSVVASNDDWRATQEQQIIDTSIPPSDDRESAILTTLQPGSYTAVVRGKSDSTGVALVEVYALQ